MAPAAYRGRFAPSPSGPLHAGSLVAALGSYLDAKANQGEWLVRIEDIDPPREIAGAADTILKQLEAHGLHWDGAVSWQSQHSERYQLHLEQLQQHQLLYACDCTRKQIKSRAPYYTGYCRQRQLAFSGNALRFINDNPILSFDDACHGHVKLDTHYAHEDFVVKRRDGLWAYQLAVVSDDRAQGITHIVRGSDLLIPSGWQLTLWQAFNSLSKAPVALPRLAHLPLVLGSDGRKLSKQNHAPPLDLKRCTHNLNQAMQQLGLRPPRSIAQGTIAELLQWAIAAWQMPKVSPAHSHPGQSGI